MKRKTMWIALLIVPLFVIFAMAIMSIRSQRPKMLGLRNGRLASCPDSPNCVSTQADREYQQMEPIPLKIDSADAMQALQRVVSAMPRTQIITADDHYLHAEFTSAMFRFVDDVEFFIDRDQGVIHFRSASRAGHSDLGVNRKRMQSIATAFEHQTAHQDGTPKTDR